MSLFDDASLVLIPDGAKASKLYSIKPTDGSGDFTFSRSTTATRVNESGLIESVATNVPRIDYSEGGCPSLLLEPQRTNLATYSEQFDNAAWGKLNATVTANATTAPDGTITADNVTWDAASGFHLVFQNFSLTSGVEYTATYFVKDNGLKYIQIYNAGNAFVPINNRYANFDIENGTLGTSTFTDASIEHYGNGWYRISVTETAQSSNTGVLAISGIQSMSDSYRPSFTGDGTSGIYIWGAQLEAGSYPTSYIPTTSAAVTRNADSCVLTGVADLIGDSEGTLYFEGSFSEDSDDRISLSDGTNANFLMLDIASGQFRFLLYNSSAVEASIIGGSANYNTDYKIALKYAENNFALYVDGIKIGEDLSGSTFNANTLTDVKFENGSGSLDFYGNVKQLTVFPTALTDTQLENLTS